MQESGNTLGEWHYRHGVMLLRHVIAPTSKRRKEEGAILAAIAPAGIAVPDGCGLRASLAPKQ